jgi:two-component system, NarL family, sensor kinase
VTEGAREQDLRVGEMSARTATWVAWSMCAVSLLLMAVSLLLTVLGWSTLLPRGWSPWRDQAITLIGFIGAPILGGLVASRRPENPYGWLWLGLGLSFALVGLAEPYAAYALVANPGSLPAPGLVNKVLALGWVVLIILIPFTFLLFPTGRLPSQRWRFLAWVVLGAGTALLPLAFFSPDSGQGPVKVPFAVGGAVGGRCPPRL